MNDIFANTETMQENEHPRFYTAESVMRGHPDKLCDLIADSVLDECLKHDPASRVACEVMATHGHIIVAGEITTSAKPDVFNIVRDTLRDVGYDPKGYQIDCYIHDQSPDIAGAVEPELAEGEDEDTLGAGDQGVMVGYACNETPEYLPMPVVAAQRLVTLLEISRMTGVIPDIGPDGKVQVTMEYNGDTPVRITTVVVSVQHKEDTDIDKLADLLDEYVFPLAFDGMPADDAEIILNPSGKFVQGGPDADTGLTGRKLMVDSYGTFAPHGGGAFSGKDATKVDRSGAYMARFIAKNIVAAGFAQRCQVTLAYAIGEAVQLLCEESPMYIPVQHEAVERERPPFRLPNPAPNNDRVTRYLLGRGVSLSAIRYCIERKILYESAEYHNCVFLGKDPQGVPKYAALRGIYDYGKPFKREAPGSQKQYGFCIPPMQPGTTVAVFEAAIDAMAEMTLCGDAADKYRLSLGGVSSSGKEPLALQEFLRQHPEITTIELRLDNDAKGRMASVNIQNLYREKYQVCDLPPNIENGDYADMAKNNLMARTAAHRAAPCR